jgi:hypothetical protein
MVMMPKQPHNGRQGEIYRHRMVNSFEVGYVIFEKPLADK